MEWWLAGEREERADKPAAVALIHLESHMNSLGTQPLSSRFEISLFPPEAWKGLKFHSTVSYSTPHNLCSWYNGAESSKVGLIPVSITLFRCWLMKFSSYCSHELLFHVLFSSHPVDIWSCGSCSLQTGKDVALLNVSLRIVSAKHCSWLQQTVAA
jgi:hypothetical protein